MSGRTHCTASDPRHHLAPLHQQHVFRDRSSTFSKPGQHCFYLSRSIPQPLTRAVTHSHSPVTSPQNMQTGFLTNKKFWSPYHSCCSRQHLHTKGHQTANSQLLLFITPPSGHTAISLINLPLPPQHPYHRWCKYEASAIHELSFLVPTAPSSSAYTPHEI